MFSYLREYSCKAIKTGLQKKKKKKKKRKEKQETPKANVCQFPKTRNLVRSSQLGKSWLPRALDTNQGQLETPEKGKTTRT
jgi:hypothetical protein